MRARLRLSVVLSAVMLVVGLPPALAAGAVCGMDVSGDVILTEDLVCVGDGLNVVADGVTIDLNGFSIVGSGTGVGVNGFGVNVTLTDGVIDGFDTGIQLSSPGGVTLDNVDVTNNRIGIFTSGGEITVVNSFLGHNHLAIATAASPSLSVDRSVFTDNDAGIVMNDQAKALIMHTSFVDNGAAVAGTQSNNITVEKSTLTGNTVGLSLFQCYTAKFMRNNVHDGDFGVVIEDADNDGAEISGNSFVNTTVGIQLGTSFGFWVGDETIISKNHFRNNGAAGILVNLAIGSANGVQIVGNTVSRSGFSPAGTTDAYGAIVDDGIHIVGDSSLLAGITVGSNKAQRNADYGIEADEVTDGGKNVAHANGSPDQCLGVDC